MSKPLRRLPPPLLARILRRRAHKLSRAAVEPRHLPQQGQIRPLILTRLAPQPSIVPRPQILVLVFAGAIAERGRLDVESVEGVIGREIPESRRD